MSGVYSYLHLHLSRDQDSRDTTSVRSTEGAVPQHQVSLRSFMTLPGHLEFDLIWRYVDRLTSQGIGSYITLDARLGWRPLRQVTISVVGQNLLEEHHAEFGAGSSGNTEIERGVYGKVVWRW